MCGRILECLDVLNLQSASAGCSAIAEQTNKFYLPSVSFYRTCASEVELLNNRNKYFKLNITESQLAGGRPVDQQYLNYIAREFSGTR